LSKKVSVEELIILLNKMRCKIRVIEFLKEQRITSKKYANLFGIIDRNNSFILEKNVEIKSTLPNKDDT